MSLLREKNFVIQSYTEETAPSKNKGGSDLSYAVKLPRDINEKPQTNTVRNKN